MRRSASATRFLTERIRVFTYDFGISETTGQRAILFADVCESTRIYQTLGDTKALALINRLFALLEKEITRHGGVTVKTLGDGLVCRFDDPDSALGAACAMQEAANGLASTTGWADLKISVGYTYGSVVLKDGDVFGDTVNVCARLVSLANPAQILTTRETVEALSPALREHCRELYSTTLRGREGEIMVCQVVWRLDLETTRVNDAEGDGSVVVANWILKLAHAGETFVVDEAHSLRIGREAGNDVIVNTEHASRLHARIFSRHGSFYIADQSTNGTYLMVDGTPREVRLRRSEAVLGERGWIGLGKSAAKHGDHVLRYRLERRSD